MSRDILVQGLPCAQFHDDEDVKDEKARCHHHEEVALYDRLSVIPDESEPSLGGSGARPGGCHENLPHRAWGHEDAQFEQQFVGKPCFAPTGILGRHPSNQLSQVGRELGSPAGLGFPAPKEAEPVAVPPDEGIRLNNDESTPPVEELAQEGHQKSGGVGGPARLDFALLEEDKLLSEEQILGRLRTPGSQTQQQEPTAIDQHLVRGFEAVNGAGRVAR